MVSDPFKSLPQSKLVVLSPFLPMKAVWTADSGTEVAARSALPADSKKVTLLRAHVLSAISANTALRALHRVLFALPGSTAMKRSLLRVRIALLVSSVAMDLHFVVHAVLGNLVRKGNPVALIALPASIRKVWEPPNANTALTGNIAQMQTRNALCVGLAGTAARAVQTSAMTAPLASTANCRGFTLVTHVMLESSAVGRQQAAAIA
jgi:hypothetical protein